MLSRPQKMSRKFFEYLQKSARIKWIYYRLGGREDMTDTKTIKVGLLGLGTVGTGGFGVKNDSMASYSPYIQNVCTVFMLLFGVNFSCYYLLIMKQVKSVYEDEELRLYVGMVLGSVLLIVINLRGFYGTLEETVRHVFFQVASIVTTTGFATTRF